MKQVWGDWSCPAHPVSQMETFHQVLGRVLGTACQASRGGDQQTIHGQERGYAPPWRHTWGALSNSLGDTSRDGLEDEELKQELATQQGKATEGDVERMSCYKGAWERRVLASQSQVHKLGVPTQNPARTSSPRRPQTQRLTTLFTQQWRSLSEASRTLLWASGWLTSLTLRILITSHLGSWRTIQSIVWREKLGVLKPVTIPAQQSYLKCNPPTPGLSKVDLPLLVVFLSQVS